MEFAYYFRLVLMDVFPYATDLNITESDWMLSISFILGLNFFMYRITWEGVSADYSVVGAEIMHSSLLFYPSDWLVSKVGAMLWLDVEFGNCVDL